MSVAVFSFSNTQALLFSSPPIYQTLYYSLGRLSQRVVITCSSKDHFAFLVIPSLQHLVRYIAAEDPTADKFLFKVSCL